MDVAKAEEATQKVELMIEKMGGVDLIVYNSGIGYSNSELDWSKEEATIEVNVLGFTALAGFAFKYFMARGQGHLVGISSVAALRGDSFSPAYGASKAFMSNYLEGLQKKAFKTGLPIVVTDIKPGFVDTDMTKGVNTVWSAPASVAAEQIYQAIRRKKYMAYITRRWRLSPG